MFVSIKGSAFGNLEAPVNISAVRCTGSEKDITECVIEDSGSCESEFYASVFCSETSIDMTGKLFFIVDKFCLFLIVNFV